MKTTRMEVTEIVPSGTTDPIAIEPMEITWELGKYGPFYSILSKVPMNRRWYTEVEIMETRRLFQLKGRKEDDAMSEEFQNAVRDLLEKLGWIYAANHGMLDNAQRTIRFRQ